MLERVKSTCQGLSIFKHVEVRKYNAFDLNYIVDIVDINIRLYDGAEFHSDMDKVQFITFFYYNIQNSSLCYLSQQLVVSFSKSSVQYNFYTS